MPRLPFADWPQEVAERRLEFLKTAAHFVPPSPSDGDDGGERLLERVSDRPTDRWALLAAAELAFAIDRTPDGITCLREAVADIFNRGGDLRLAAVPGAIAGVAVTRPVENGFLIQSLSPSGDARQGRYSNDPLTPEGLSLALDLLLASLASGVPLEDLDQANQPSEGLSLPPSEAIVQALPLFDAARRNATSRYEMAHQALWLNAVHWSNDLQLHHRDRYHWEQARVNGSIIDMRRLAFEIALRRSPEGDRLITLRRDRLLDGLPGRLEGYIGELADEILSVLQ